MIKSHLVCDQCGYESHKVFVNQDRSAEDGWTFDGEDLCYACAQEPLRLASSYPAVSPGESSTVPIGPV